MSEQNNRRPAHEVILDLFKRYVGAIGRLTPEEELKDIFATVDTLSEVLEAMVIPKRDLAELYLGLLRLAKHAEEMDLHTQSAVRLRAVLASFNRDYPTSR